VYRRAVCRPATDLRWCGVDSNAIAAGEAPKAIAPTMSCGHTSNVFSPS